MESEFFLNNGIPPQPSSLLFESTSPLSATIPIHFESAMSSMVSSPDVSNYTMSNESFMIRELIGKIGNINNSSSLETAEISPNSKQIVAASFMNIVDSTTTNTSCYSTPLNSPPQMSLHVMDRVQSEQMGFPRLGNHHPVGLNPNPNVQVQHPIAEFTADPGFAERAARFSCFGRRSFNGRTGINNGELPYRGNALNGKMVRVSSSPSLKVMVQQGNTSSSPLQDRSELGNSNQDESMVCERFTNGDIKGSSELNSRKRKASKDKAKEPTPIPQTKDADSNGTSNSKRSKPNKVAGNEIEPVKAEDEAKARENEKQSDNLKPIEPPKDYIHVRARRGQATDSHSLAERVRREKISERMKLLQDLVPGCNKVTGKALMLDEIINYVQSLQRQVEFLSMKLASVNTRMDFNMDTPITKDIFQSNNSQQQPIFALDSSASAIFGHQSQQNPALNSIISNGLVTKCSVDSLAVQQLTPLCGNNPTIPPYPTFCEDDLQTIVQMGFGQNLNLETALQTQDFHGTNQLSQMKTEP